MKPKLRNIFKKKMIQGYELHDKSFRKYTWKVRIFCAISTIILLSGYFLACVRIGIVPGLSMIIFSLGLFVVCYNTFGKQRHRHREIRDKFKTLSEKNHEEKEYRKELKEIKDLERKWFGPKIIVV